MASPNDFDLLSREPGNNEPDPDATGANWDDLLDELFPTKNDALRQLRHVLRHTLPEGDTPDDVVKMGHRIMSQKRIIDELSRANQALRKENERLQAEFKALEAILDEKRYAEETQHQHEPSW